MDIYLVSERCLMAVLSLNIVFLIVHVYLLYYLNVFYAIKVININFNTLI